MNQLLYYISKANWQRWASTELGLTLLSPQNLQLVLTTHLGPVPSSNPRRPKP